MKNTKLNKFLATSTFAWGIAGASMLSVVDLIVNEQVVTYASEAMYVNLDGNQYESYGKSSDGKVTVKLFWSGDVHAYIEATYAGGIVDTVDLNVFGTTVHTVTDFNTGKPYTIYASVSNFQNVESWENYYGKPAPGSSTPAPAPAPTPAPVPQPTPPPAVEQPKPEPTPPPVVEQPKPNPTPTTKPVEQPKPEVVVPVVEEIDGEVYEEPVAEEVPVVEGVEIIVEETEEVDTVNDVTSSENEKEGQYEESNTEREDKVVEELKTPITERKETSSKEKEPKKEVKPEKETMDYGMSLPIVLTTVTMLGLVVWKVSSNKKQWENAKHRQSEVEIEDEDDDQNE